MNVSLMYNLLGPVTAKQGGRQYPVEAKMGRVVCRQIASDLAITRTASPSVHTRPTPVPKRKKHEKNG